MGADQQFCLRWNNFHTNITSAFESLRDDEDFVDITLACEGKQIKAHKMVLSACSPYFRSLLKGNPCQHPIVFLKDVTFANLTSILDFMYHGEVNVSHNELATFLKTAESLKVRGLAEDEKKKEAEGYNEASSPPPPRDPPDPGSPRGPGEEANSAPDTHTSDSPPPPKRQRRRSGASIHSAEDTNETVLSEPRDNSVKNEPQDYNEDDADILIHSDNTQDIKQDIEDNSEERNFGLSESVTISRSQAAMQQLQESFGSFLPGMGQSPGFLPHGATDMPRPPPYSLEGVQGLPPGISALPGPSMSQGAASQDASQGGAGSRRSLLHTACVCPYCNKVISNKYNLKTHILDKHTLQTESFPCDLCGRIYSTKHSLATHNSTVHRGDRNVPSHRVGGVGGAAGLQVSVTDTTTIHTLTNNNIRHNTAGSLTNNAMATVSVSRDMTIPTSMVPSSTATSVASQNTLPGTNGLVGFQSGGDGTNSNEGTPSFGELVASIPSSTSLEGGPSQEQIQAMADSLAQSMPSFQSFPGLQ